MRRLLLMCLAVVAALAIGGCASPGSTDTRGAAPRRNNDLLNDGYSLLYSAASGLRFSDDLLLVKFESDRLQKVIKDVSSTSDTLRTDLQRIARDYPAVRIDRQPLPANRDREAQRRQQGPLAQHRAGRRPERPGFRAHAAAEQLGCA